MRRPAALAYWVSEKPPARIALALAMQQLAFLAALLTVPAYFANQLDLSPTAFEHVAAATLLYGAITMCLHAWGRFGIGSGLFLPIQGTTATLPALLMAYQSDAGLATSFGMVVIIGLTQFLFSAIIKRLRGIFTVEVAGLAVLLVGAGIGQLGLTLIFTPEREAVGEWGHLALAAITFLTMVALNVWGKGLIKLFATLIGLVVGFLISIPMPHVDSINWAKLSVPPWFQIPVLHSHGWAWDWAQVVPYIVTGVALSLTSMGVQTVAQRFNDADFKQPNLSGIAGGLRAEGIGMGLASLFNAIPMVASGGAVSLAAATGCTSRVLAYWTAVLLAILAFMPKVIIAWLLLPQAVAGGLFLFLSCFATLSGLQLVGSRLLDNRKILALGTGLLVGMTHAQIKEAITLAAPFLHGFLFSAFAMGITVSVLLSAFFRLGRTQRARSTLPLDTASLESVTSLVEDQGRVWGVPQGLEKRAETAVWQVVEMLLVGDLTHEAHPHLRMGTSFDEVRFIVTLSWSGHPIELADSPPSHDELLEDPQAQARLAGYLVGRLCDQVTVNRDADRVELRLVFNA